MLILTITNASGYAYQFTLEPVAGTCYRIGRSSDCEIALPQEVHLSRVHCILTVGAGYALLSDNNSSNGIFENGQRRQEFTMFPGQEYRIGSCAISISYPAEVPTPAAEPLPEPAEVPTPAAEPLPDPAEVPTPAVEAPAPQPPPRHRRFIPPPPRKALVKRPAPRPVRTAAGTLNTETELPAPKALKQRHSPLEPKVKRPPSEPADSIGLPWDFELSLRLLNTTATLIEGDLLQFSVEAAEECYLYLIQYDSAGNAALLVPGVGGAQNRLQANTKAVFPPPGKNTDYELYVEPPYGQDLILAIACTRPCPFPKIWHQCSAEADSLTPRGETEQKAIAFCNELRSMSSARWAAALLRIHTGPNA